MLFHDVHHRVFGGRTHTFVIFSAPEGRLSLGETLKSAADDLHCVAIDIEDLLPRVAGKFAVILTSYDVILGQDVAGEAVEEYTRRHFITPVSVHSLEIFFISKDDAVRIFNNSFCRESQHPCRIERNMRVHRHLDLRASEWLRSATFSMMGMPSYAPPPKEPARQHPEERL